LSLALVGGIMSLLALGLPEAGGWPEGEVLEPLRIVALEASASHVLGRAEEPPLRPAARLTALPDARFALDENDQGADDASDRLLLLLEAQTLPVVAAARGGTNLPYVCCWPTYYLVRPQRLSRL
jgi:hypothetical protein